MNISRGSIKVFTFKDGLLARLAHDLQLSLGRFEFEIDGDRVVGRFWPDSLTVDGPVRDGQVHPEELSDSDRQKIRQNVMGEILHTDRNPEITFTGRGNPATSDRFLVRGELLLNGRSQPLEIEVRTGDGMYHGEISLTPSRWGIPPYKAMAGALKLQDRVLLRFDLPIP